MISPNAIPRLDPSPFIPLVIVLAYRSAGHSKCDLGSLPRQRARCDTRAAMKVLFLMLACAALIHGSPIYTIANLGNLGGSSATGFQINDAGAVVGWAETVTGNQQAFAAAAGGTLRGLNSQSASDSYAFDINGANTIVGTSYVNGEEHGTVWSGSSTTDLGAGVFAMAINSTGTITGSNGHAFTLVNGTYQDLGVLPGGDWSAAYGINDSGTVAGYGDIASGLFRAIIWNPDGTVTELGTLGGANSYATAINNGGQVIGHAGTTSGFDHAFTETGRSMQDLGTLDGGCSYAYGINDAGTIVGYSWSETEDTPRAFVYSGGAMRDLNSLITPGSGWQLEQAYGINAAGEIVGVGTFRGQSSAFLLTPISPIPEPHPIVLLLVILFIIAGTFRHRMRYLG